MQPSGYASRPGAPLAPPALSSAATRSSTRARRRRKSPRAGASAARGGGPPPRCRTDRRRRPGSRDRGDGEEARPTAGGSELTAASSACLRLSARGGVPRTPACRSTRRSEEHTSELQSRGHVVCRLLLEKKKEGAQNYTSRKDTKRSRES